MIFYFGRKNECNKNCESTKCCWQWCRFHFLCILYIGRNLNKSNRIILLDYTRWIKTRTFVIGFYLLFDKRYDYYDERNKSNSNKPNLNYNSNHMPMGHLCYIKQIFSTFSRFSHSKKLTHILLQDSDLQIEP